MGTLFRRCRSGRIFSPYEPWAVQLSPTQQPCDGGGDSSDDDEPLAVAFSSLKIGPLLKSAFASEEQRAADGVGDCECDVHPPPPSFLSNPPPSPLTSPEASPSLAPSATEGRVPSLCLTDLPPPPPPCTPATAAPSAVPLSSLTEKQRRTKRERQRRKREREKEEKDPLLYRMSASLSQKWSRPHAWKVDWPARLLTAARGAFVGVRPRHDRSTPYTLQELVEAGFRVIEWDGRSPYAIVDDGERIIVMLCGWPRGEDWAHVTNGATDALLRAGEKLGAMKSHRRGKYRAASAGASLGGGSQYPGMLRNSTSVQQVVDELRADPNIRRLAGYASSQFAFYFPKVYGHYSKNLRPLFERHTYLSHNFDNSIFPACTFNMGPSTVALKHADTSNSATGGCPVSSGGNYNHKLGGHLILFDLKIVVEFPPGATIIVPSSTLTHGNTAIQPGETRVSFTQYCAGGLIRWVEYGFRTLKACAQQKPKLKAKLDARAEARWSEALDRFSKVDQLHNDRVKVFKI